MAGENEEGQEGEIPSTHPDFRFGAITGAAQHAMDEMREKAAEATSGIRGQAEHAMEGVRDTATHGIDHLREEASGAMANVTGRLDLTENDRLPWLESAEGEEEHIDNRRVAGFVIGGLALLAAIVGGIWWFTHNGPAPRPADGSLVAAPATPYKTAPADPGGKNFEGQGQTSYAVAQGRDPGANAGAAPAVTGAPATPAAKPSESAAAKPEVPAAKPAGEGSMGGSASTGGPGVQVAAYTNAAAAEAGWATLSKAHAALQGVPHRVVEGSADIGTVYRLQAVPGGLDAAEKLCGTLRNEGLACAVKK
jgi:hypothetical protein